MALVSYTERTGKLNLPVASINDLTTDLAALKILALNSSGKLIEAAAGDGARCVGLTGQGFDKDAYASPNVLTPAPTTIDLIQSGRLDCIKAASETAAGTKFLLVGTGTNGAIVQADLGQPVFATAGRTLKVNPVDGTAPYFGKVVKIVTVGTDGDGEAQVEFNLPGGPEIVTATCSFHSTADSVDKHFFIANRRYRVLGIRFTPRVVGSDGGAVTLAIKKTSGVQQPSAGTALMSGTFDLKGTADTVQAATLSTTAAALILSPGDSLAADFDGTTTAAVGAATVDLIPID